VEQEWNESGTRVEEEYIKSRKNEKPTLSIQTIIRGYRTGVLNHIYLLVFCGFKV
jgi:hypothetical protein